jgi:hypothetical protein
MQKMIVITLCLIYFKLGIGQIDFTDAEKLQGYKEESTTVYFVFDEKIYSVNPLNVIVEGSFRNWDHNMDRISIQIQNKRGRMDGASIIGT